MKAFASWNTFNALRVMPTLAFGDQGYSVEKNVELLKTQFTGVTLIG